MLEDALEHLVRGIVDHPDDVERAQPRGTAAAVASRCGSTPTTSAA